MPLRMHKEYGVVVTKAFLSGSEVAAETHLLESRDKGRTKLRQIVGHVAHVYSLSNHIRQTRAGRRELELGILR